MPSKLNEASLEELIVEQMTALGTRAPAWREGDPTDYLASYGVVLSELAAFIAGTQPSLADALNLDTDGPSCQKFLARVQGEITKHGIVAVLRAGVDYNQHHVDLYYPCLLYTSDAADE